MKVRNLFLFASLALLFTGCATEQTAPPKTELKTVGAWEVNKAVMTAAERSGNYEVALNTGEEELKLRPDNDEAKVIVARLLSRTGQPQRASAILETVSSDPEGLVVIERARSLVAMGMGNLARQLMEESEAKGKIIGRDNQFEAHKLLAVALDLEGNHKKAQQLYTKLLTQREDGAVRMNCGRSLIATHDYSQAAEMLMPLADDPRYPMARVLAAGALKRSGEKEMGKNLLEGYLPDNRIEELMRK